jgi:hypothetical protein
MSKIAKEWSKEYPEVGKVDFTILRLSWEPPIETNAPYFRQYWFTGYCTFPGTFPSNIDVDLVSVHGGVTFSRSGRIDDKEGESSPGHTYGFDTNHCFDSDDSDNKCNDVEGYLTRQCENMAEQIITLAKEEGAFKEPHLAEDPPWQEKADADPRKLEALRKKGFPV